MLVNIEEGETVQWSCEYGDSKALSCSIQEMDYELNNKSKTFTFDCSLM